MKIVVTGGGTGGHIYPALAFVREMKKYYSSIEVLYIGSETGLEKSIVEKEGLLFRSITISGFKRKISFDNVKTVMRFLKAVSTSKTYLKEFQPDIVIGTGGYVCGPVVYAAAKLKIPTIVHEQNSVPGITNKFLSRYVDGIALCFEEALQYFPKEKCELTGNPRATEVTYARNDFSLTTLGLQNDKKTVLITGGSRGAKVFYESVVESYSELSERNYQIILVTGDVHFENVRKQLPEKLASNICIVPFLHNMLEVMKKSDIIVSRAGATILSEITSLGIPSILVPSPYVTANHQEVNARSIEKHNAAIVITEKEMNGKSLLQNLDRCFKDNALLQNMSRESKKIGVPEASEKLREFMEQIIKEKKK